MVTLWDLPYFPTSAPVLCHPGGLGLHPSEEEEEGCGVDLCVSDRACRFSPRKSRVGPTSLPSRSCCGVLVLVSKGPELCSSESSRILSVGTC